LSQFSPVHAGESAAQRAITAAMLEPLLAGLVAGWGVAIPLGAIGVMVVDLGMRGGFRPAAAAAAGVATADCLYAAVAAAAGAAAASLLAPHEHALRLVSAGVLAAVAVLGLLALRRRADAAPAAPAATHHVYARFIALTSINPTTVVYFAALIAGLPAVASAPASAKLVFVLAAGVASLSWQLVLAGSGAALHHRLPPSARIWTAVAGNALVLGLAVRMALAA
jgi:threonine/homoserine/homoserine lactone efflux protein